MSRTVRSNVYCSSDRWCFVTAASGSRWLIFSDITKICPTQWPCRVLEDAQIDPRLPPSLACGTGGEQPPWPLTLSVFASVTLGLSVVRPEIWGTGRLSQLGLNLNSVPVCMTWGKSFHCIKSARDFYHERIST